MAFTQIRAHWYASLYRHLADYRASPQLSIHETLRAIGREYPEYLVPPALAAGTAAVVTEMEFNRRVAFLSHSSALPRDREGFLQRIADEERAAVEKATRFFARTSTAREEYKSKLEERLGRMKADH